MIKPNTSTHSHAPTPRQSRNIPQLFGSKQQTHCCHSICLHCPVSSWVFLNRHLFTNKSKKKNRGREREQESNFMTSAQSSSTSSSQNLGGESGERVSAERPPAALITSQTKSGWIIGEKYGRWRTSLSISSAQQTSQRGKTLQQPHVTSACLLITHGHNPFNSSTHTDTRTRSLSHALIHWQYKIHSQHFTSNTSLNSPVILRIKIRNMGLYISGFCIIIKNPIK